MNAYWLEAWQGGKRVMSELVARDAGYARIALLEARDTGTFPSGDLVPDGAELRLYQNATRVDGDRATDTEDQG